MSEFNPFEKQPEEIEIDLDAERPLEHLTDEQLAAVGGVVGVHVAFPAPPDADPDEEPPEPEGHALPKAVADWINHGQEYFHGHLPPDVAAIWAHPPHRPGDEATARILIAAWGMDTFRASALHQTALAEVARQVNSSEIETHFKSEREKAKRR